MALGPPPHGYLSWAEWGGSPNLPLTKMRLPVSIDVAHHTVTNETADAAHDMRVLEQHAESLGHAFVDYSDAIHPSGTILAGRIDNVGGHTFGYNATATGTVFIGDYRFDTLTPAAKDSYRWLIAHRIEVGILVPGVYPTWGHTQVPNNSTECPAVNVLTQFPELRLPYGTQGDDMTNEDWAKLSDWFWDLRNEMHKQFRATRQELREEIEQTERRLKRRLIAIEDHLGITPPEN